MGLYKKESVKDVVPDTQEEQGNLFAHVVAIIASTPDPSSYVGMIIAKLLELGVVGAESLEKIGITLDEIESLVAALNNVESLEELDQELEIRAAIRRYDKVLVEIGNERGLLPGSESFKTLRTVLAGFAADNNLTDLRIAYRLLLAESPELLDGPVSF